MLKALKCCGNTRQRGLDYVWIDNCCIDKSSSAELSEAINSMFSWYENAVEYYVYLSDVPDKPFEESMWFTRGWTLQELIAPRVERFYDRDWKLIGDKRSLDTQLATITKIPTEVLLNEDRLSGYSIAQRMSWASKRTTTRVEDRAYSLLGIFSIHMPMLYGEGKAAFRRLQEELIKRSDDLTILFWEDKDHPRNLLAPSPSAFEFSSSVENLLMSAGAGFKRSHLFSLTNIGLSMKLILIPWAIDVYVAVVGCSEHMSSVNGVASLSLTRRWYCIYLHVNINPYTDELMYRTCYDGKSTLELYGKWNEMKWDPPWCAVDSFNRTHRMSEKECMVRLVGPNGLRPGVHGIRLHIRGGGKRVWGPTSRLEAEDIQCSAGYEFEANKDYRTIVFCLNHILGSATYLPKSTLIKSTTRTTINTASVSASTMMEALFASCPPWLALLPLT